MGVRLRAPGPTLRSLSRRSLQPFRMFLSTVAFICTFSLFESRELLAELLSSLFFCCKSSCVLWTISASIFRRRPSYDVVPLSPSVGEQGFFREDVPIAKTSLLSAWCHPFELVPLC